MNNISLIMGSWLAVAQSGVTGPSSSHNFALWAVVLIGVAVVLFFLEIFVPSGGVIGMLAAVALVAGVVLLFRINTTVGLIGAIASLMAVPFLFGFALKLWPSTPIAQILLLKSPPCDSTERSDTKSSEQLIGVSGQALTDLRPVGTCLIDGRRQQCLAESGLIRRGSRVKVVSTDAMGVKVRLDT